MMTKLATRRKAVTVVLLGLCLLATNGCCCVGPCAPVFPLLPRPGLACGVACGGGCGDVCGDPCGDYCGDLRGGDPCGAVCGDPCGGCGGCGGLLGFGLLRRPIFGCLGIFHEVLSCVSGCGGTYVGEWTSDPPGADPCCGSYYQGSACDACKPSIRPNLAGIRYEGCSTGNCTASTASGTGCSSCERVAVSSQPVSDSDVTNELAVRRTVSPRHRPYRASSHVRQAVHAY